MSQQNTDKLTHQFSFLAPDRTQDVAASSRSLNEDSLDFPCGKYDVFLSFRGEDTRSKFSYYLYRAFLVKKLRTFRDDDEIDAGQGVSTELLEAIKESKCAVIVISENYASSSWCLNELLQILECRKSFGQTVCPIFYDVNPSDVRKLKGTFGKGFSKAVSSCRKNAQKWKKALEEIAGLKGWVYPSQGYWSEYHFIAALAGDISHKIKATPLDPLEGLVGMKSRMDKLLDLIDLGSDEPRMVGICGMGGVGKTTIARAVYNSIHQEFDGFCFIENVREVAIQSGLKSIQEIIISDISKEKGFKVASVESGRYALKKRVRHKRVLIVLDDVDKPIELKTLMGNLLWFSHGSRIIVTTRDKHLLTASGIKDIYEVPLLDTYEIQALFISMAFESYVVPEKFQMFIDRALEYGDGPSAFKVLVSFLSKLTLGEQEAAMDKLENIPGDGVQKVFRIGYDGLNSQEKEIFLDICCFFRGKYKDEVINLLDSGVFNSFVGVEGLVRKKLLTILENGKVWMPGLLQTVAWNIVQEESQEEPGKRSRLWHHNDIKHVFTENTGTRKIEGIYDNYPAIGTEDFELRPNAFAKMTNLRVLKICYTCSSIDLPNSLRYLHWHGYPLKCMPRTFQPEHLVELRLTHSRIVRIWWDEKMELPKLTVLDLGHSVCLTRSPQLTGSPNLEKLFLEGCTSLRYLHPSIRKLEKLTILVLKGCISLKTIPNGFESQCLKILIFSDCFRLRKILEKFKDLKQLLELYLDGTGIKEVPRSIGQSTDLCYLDLSRCQNLKLIPSSIGELKKLKKLLLPSCSGLNDLPEEVGLIESLEILDVANSGVRKLPLSVVGLKNLQVLSLRGCFGFPSNSEVYLPLSCFLPARASHCMTLVLPSLSRFDSLTILDLSFCRLNSIPQSISCCLLLKELTLTKSMFESLPASIKDLGNLEKLCLRKCKKLRELPKLPSTVKYLMTSGCESLTSICSPYLFKDARLLCFSNCSKLVANEETNSFMEHRFLLNQIKVNNHDEFRVYTGPRSKIPNWFTNQNVGASIKFQLPPHDKNLPNILGIALSAVVSTNAKECKIGVQIRVGGSILKRCWAFLFYQNLLDVCILYFPIREFMVDRFRSSWTELEVCFSTTEFNDNTWTSLVDDVLGPAPEVKSCGVCLMYDHDLDIEERDEDEIGIEERDEEDLNTIEEKDDELISSDIPKHAFG